MESFTEESAKGGLSAPPQRKEEGLRLVEVHINLIKANPNQPRKSFDNEHIESLSQSLAQDGFLQPLVVLPLGSDGFYPLIAGERRLRAAKRLGMTKVPILIRYEEDGSSVGRLALIENIQRRDLTVLEEAKAYKELIEDHGLTHEECARQLGVERSKVTNFLRLLTLPTLIQASLGGGSLTMGHGRALLGLKGCPGLMLEAHELVLKRGLSVRQTEALCRKLLKERESSVSGEGEEENPNLDYIADSLREKLKTKVRLLGSGVRGKIEISYFSPAEFERILNLIK